MKSGRYQVLPRVRKICDAKHGTRYKATWRDPGNLTQRVGEPLRYVFEYVGRGYTIDAALTSLRRAYIHEQEERVRLRELTYKEIDKMLMDEKVYFKTPAHCLATSNLPWWRRLFRV